MHLPNMKLLTPIRAIPLTPMPMLVMRADIMKLTSTVERRHPLGRTTVPADAHANAVHVFAVVRVGRGRHHVAFAAEGLDRCVDVRVLFRAFDGVGPVGGAGGGGYGGQGEEEGWELHVGIVEMICEWCVVCCGLISIVGRIPFENRGCC